MIQIINSWSEVEHKYKEIWNNFKLEQLSKFKEKFKVFYYPPAILLEDRISLTEIIYRRITRTIYRTGEIIKTIYCDFNEVKKVTWGTRKNYFFLLSRQDL